MEWNTLSDEDLIRLYRQGVTEALDILFHRYLDPLRGYLLKYSWFKDDSYLDDLIQQILMIAFTRIKEKAFEPKGDGSFRHYLYRIGTIEYKKQDCLRASELPPLSRRFPNVSTGFADERVPSRPVETPNHHALHKKLSKAFKALATEEIKLLIMANLGIPYEKILAHPLFSKFTLAYLKLKIYNIRQKVIKIIEEEKDEPR